MDPWSRPNLPKLSYANDNTSRITLDNFRRLQNAKSQLMAPFYAEILIENAMHKLQKKNTKTCFSKSGKFKGGESVHKQV